MRKCLLVIISCFIGIYSVYAQDTTKVRKNKDVRSKETGIGVLTDETPSHSQSSIDDYNILSISFKKDTVLITKESRLWDDPNRFNLFYNTSIGFERVASLPKTRNQDVQRDFFRTGLIVKNDITFAIPFNIKKRGKEDYYYNNLPVSYIEANLGQYLRNSPIRNSNMESYNFSMTAKSFLHENVNILASVAYSNAQDKLLNQGANMSSIVGSMLMTPPAFDNSYSFINALPDKERGDQFLASLITNYGNFNNSHRNPYGILSSLNTSFQYISQDRVLGIPSDFTIYEAGHLSRIKNNTKIGEIAWKNFYYKTYGYRYDEDKCRYNRRDKAIELKFMCDYILDIEQKDYVQQNFSHLADGFQKLRIAHELNYAAQIYHGYKNFYYNIQLFSRHYFSNTITDYVNWFPTAELSLSYEFKTRRVLKKSEKVSETFHGLSLDFNTGRSMNEAPLIYTDPAVLSILFPSSAFYRYFETQGLYALHKLKPETSGEYNVQLLYAIRMKNYNALQFSAIWRYATHRDMVFPVLPVYQYHRFQLENVAAATCSDLSINARYSLRKKKDFSMWLQLQWSKGWNKVKSTQNGAYIPVAGFSNISTGMLAGNPVGTIYGTTWLRDENGNRIIGDDGFPLVNNTLSMIGDPTPDWKIHFIPSFTWKKFTLSFVLYAQKGGDKWNGTAAVLDYLGLSQTTVEQRETEVGEAYIVDASSLRFSEINLSYAIPVKRNRVVEDLKIGVSVHNILLYSKYDGVDPLSTLYSNPSGTGLDMFNIPSVRSYMLNIQIVFKK